MNSSKLPPVPYCRKTFVSAPSFRAESLLSSWQSTAYPNLGTMAAGLRASRPTTLLSTPSPYIESPFLSLSLLLLPRSCLIPLLPRTCLEPSHTVPSHGCLENLTQGNANDKATRYLNTTPSLLCSTRAPHTTFLNRSRWPPETPTG
jgi:hypothetical protein